MKKVLTVQDLSCVGCCSLTVALPVLSAMGCRCSVLPTGVYRNRHFAEEWGEPGETELAIQDLLYDPQTSGGLMMAVHPEDAPALLEELRQENRVPAPQLVGRVAPYTGGKRIYLH